MSRSSASPAAPARPRKSPLRLATAGESALRARRPDGHLSPPQLRAMMISEFEQWLRSRTNKQKRAFHQDTILRCLVLVPPRVAPLHLAVHVDAAAVRPDPTSTPPRGLPMRRNLSHCSPDEGTSRQPASFFHGPNRITGASHGKPSWRAADGGGRAGLSACAIPVRIARRRPTAGHFRWFRPGPCPWAAAGLRSVKESDRAVNRVKDSCVS
jgi:hypothetical protein